MTFETYYTGVNNSNVLNKIHLHSEKQAIWRTGQSPRSKVQKHKPCSLTHKVLSVTYVISQSLTGLNLQNLSLISQSLLHKSSQWNHLITLTTEKLKPINLYKLLYTKH